MNEKLETIAQESKGAVRAGLYKGKDHVYFEYKGLFDKHTCEQISAKGKMTKEAYAQGIAGLAEKGCCRIPLAEEKGHIEISKKDDRLIISLENRESSIHGAAVGWDFFQNLYVQNGN